MLVGTALRDIKENEIVFYPDTKRVVYSAIEFTPEFTTALFKDYENGFKIIYSAASYTKHTGVIKNPPAIQLKKTTGGCIITTEI